MHNIIVETLHATSLHFFATPKIAVVLSVIIYIIIYYMFLIFEVSKLKKHLVGDGSR